MASKKKGIIHKSRDRIMFNYIKAIDELDNKLSTLEINQMLILENNKLLYSLFTQLKNKSGSTIYRISDNEIITKIFSGIKMSLNPEDISLTPHLALDGIWEKEFTTAWLQILTSKDTVLDIGANFGYYGLLAAQQTSVEKSKVIFFEANPRLIPYINKSLSINNYYEYSRVENLAVDEKEGVVTLNVLKDYLGSSSINTLEQLDGYVGKKIHLEVKEKIKVKSITIDKYCLDNKILTIDLIKMDIEGYEDKAYRGMRNVIKASPRVTMFLEFTKNGYENPEEFFNMLLQDFKEVYLIARDGALVKPKVSNYSTVIGNVDDWVMLVFTKNPSIIKNMNV